MRAAFYEATGPARDVLRVGDVETPKPGPGEVRVRVRASGVNPSDVKSRGLRKLAFSDPAQRWCRRSRRSARRTDLARGSTCVDLNDSGSGRPNCRRVHCAARRQPALPGNVSFEAGACLGIPAMTAYPAVELAGANNGTTLFVSGGAGSVRVAVIQFAKARGATVITTISSEDKAKAAREAGADH